MSTSQRKYKNGIFMYCKNIFRETVINVSSDQIEMQISGSIFTGKNHHTNYKTKYYSKLKRRLIATYDCRNAQRCLLSSSPN